MFPILGPVLKVKRPCDIKRTLCRGAGTLSGASSDIILYKTLPPTLAPTTNWPGTLYRTPSPSVWNLRIHIYQRRLGRDCRTIYSTGRATGDAIAERDRYRQENPPSDANLIRRAWWTGRNFRRERAVSMVVLLYRVVRWEWGSLIISVTDASHETLSSLLHKSSLPW